MAATVRGDKRNDLVEGTPFDLGPAGALGPTRRIPEVLVGTLLVALFALVGAWFHSTATAKVGYLAVRRDVARGQVIEQADLTVHELTTDAPIRAARGSEAGRIVGKVATIDLAIGTLISADLVADTSGIPTGSGVVGLDLAPGEYPTPSLRPGDRVRVVVLAAGGGAADPDAVAVVAEDVEVVEVIDVGGRGRFVSLTMATDLADRVTAAHAQDRVRLIQVAGS